jgi:hypothetical protein
MALSLGISRDVQVSYSISDVKAAVEEVASKSKAKCQIEGRDDVMNTFKIALIGGLAVIVPITLQLKKVSDTETQIVLTSNKATNTGNQANNIADAFLGKVSQALSGTLDEAEAKSKSGCLGIGLFLLGGLSSGLLGVFYLIF